MQQNPNMYFEMSLREFLMKKSNGHNAFFVTFENHKSTISEQQHSLPENILYKVKQNLLISWFFYDIMTKNTFCT